MVVVAGQPNESAVKDARSKLLEVLANIRSGKIEEEYDYDEGDDQEQEFAPPPQKRRHTANYVALSGITRRTRSTDESKNASKSFTAGSSTTPPSATVRPSTFVLKLFDRTVDLAQFCHADANEDASLYPVCRAWVHSQQINQDPRTSRNKLLVYPTAQDSSQEGAGGVGNIYRLPKPEDKRVLLQDEAAVVLSSDTEINLRIPNSVRDWVPDTTSVQENLDKLIDSKSGDAWSANERLVENCKRWKAVRDQWKAAAQLNESRYFRSSRILRDIYLTNTIKHADM